MKRLQVRLYNIDLKGLQWYFSYIDIDRGSYDMELEYGDIVVFKTNGQEHKSVVSKVDGNVIKLFEEDGSYRQVAMVNLKDMLENGFVVIEKSSLNNNF